MRRICLLSVLTGLLLSGTGWGSIVYEDEWLVATVHGTRQFEISPDASTLTYFNQPKTNYVWYENNGSPSGTIATYNGENRSGMRTFAVTDVAAGQKLSDLQFEFTYDGSLGYTTINFFITDGNGHFGIFAPASKGLASVDDIVDNGDGTKTLSFDLSDPTIDTNALVAVYEHNGFVNEYGTPYTTMTWGAIKDFTIAGMYDYQRSPTGGWEAWGSMVQRH